MSLCLIPSGESSHHILSLMNGELTGETTKVSRYRLESIFFLHLFWLYFEFLLSHFQISCLLPKSSWASDSEWTHRPEWSWTGHRDQRLAFLGTEPELCLDKKTVFQKATLGCDKVAGFRVTLLPGKEKEVSKLIKIDKATV